MFTLLYLKHEKQLCTKHAKTYLSSCWLRQVRSEHQYHCESSLEKVDVVEGYICCNHHYEHTGRKHGLSSASEFSRMVLKGVAERSGYANTTEYLNSKHPYRKFRKDYCENRDGRLGFACTYTPPPVELIEQRLTEENHYI